MTEENSKPQPLVRRRRLRGREAPRWPRRPRISARSRGRTSPRSSGVSRTWATNGKKYFEASISRQQHFASLSPSLFFPYLLSVGDLWTKQMRNLMSVLFMMNLRFGTCITSGTLGWQIQTSSYSIICKLKSLRTSIWWWDPIIKLGSRNLTSGANHGLIFLTRLIYESSLKITTIFISIFIDVWLDLGYFGALPYFSLLPLSLACMYTVIARPAS